jgi:hypothetical protein
VGGEVLELKTELLQEQKEEGGDRACLDLSGQLQRGPTQEAAH